MIVDLKTVWIVINEALMWGHLNDTASKLHSTIYRLGVPSVLAGLICNVRVAVSAITSYSAEHNQRPVIMLPDVKQKTINPVITETGHPGALIRIDEYDIYSRVTEWDYGHKTVCQSKCEYARDEDGDGFSEPKNGFRSISDSLNSYIMSANEGEPFLDPFSRYC